MAIDRCPVLNLNTRAEEMFGIGREEALASPFGRWCPPASDQTLTDNLLAYLSGKKGFEGETIMRKADGSLFPVHISTAFPTEFVTRPAGTFAIMDISDRVARELELARAHAELAHAARVATLGELTASIAHEINQPLAAVVTNGNAALRWLRRATPDRGEATEAISHMIEEGSRASQIIARTRQLATKGTGERAILSCNAMISETLAIVERQISGLGAEIQLDLSTDLPFLFADRVQLQQVLINLLVNAAQAMADHGSSIREIHVTTRYENAMAVLDVHDTGPDFSNEQASQLFNAFYTTKATGMGIGLSVSKTIIEAHGGTIAAAPVSGGANFRVQLPVADGNAAAEAA